MRRGTERMLRLVLVLVTIVILGYVLSVGRNLLYPICLAILFSYLLYPLASLFENTLRFPRIAANFATLFVAFGGLVIVISVSFSQVKKLSEDLPMLRAKALQNVEIIQSNIEEVTGVSISSQRVWIRQQVNNLFEGSSRALNSVFSATASTATTIGLMPVFIFFMLFYRDKFRTFILKITPDPVHDRTVRIMNEVNKVTLRYMTGIFTVVFILCILNSVGLLIVGVRYALILGILSAVCNFIPYFGTLIGAAFPLGMAIFTEDSPSKALGVIILFIIIQFTENNILTPTITGGNVKLNPFVTILAIILGGLFWGLPGMFIVVPALGMLKVSMDYIDNLRPYAYLIGKDGMDKHAIDFGRILKKRK